MLVFDMAPVFLADALAIAAGLVRGGGLLTLLVAPPDPRPFGRRVERFLAEPAVDWVGADGALPVPLAVRHSPVLHLNRGQAQLFRRIVELPLCRAPARLVLTAPRGRGKSTLLGMLVRHWRMVNGLDVRVTALNPDAVRPLLRAVEASADPGPRGTGGSAGIFVAPDQLLNGGRWPGILVVDEAATLPVHRLHSLAALAPRSVFATTTAGFEGSGRGFRLRFLRGLRSEGQAVTEYRLQLPVRWPPGDPLEDWVNRLFLLDAEVAAGGPVPGIPAVLPVRRRVTWVSGAGLAGREADLAALVGLLSDAHYRTRPSDLQRWLDDPHLRIGLLHGPGHALLGAVLLLAEPGLGPALARAVWAGERRPPGRFLPCVLAAHGAPSLAARAVLRVTRIVVHPRWRRRGLGRYLLRAAERHARAGGFGLLGASFGANVKLLSFWQSAAFQPLRIGFRRETTSGLHAAVVLRPLDRVVAPALEALRAGIAGDWPIWRAGPLRSLETATAEWMRQSLPPPSGADPARDREQVRAFACRQRPFELALPALHRWFRSAGSLGSLNVRQRALLQRALTDLDDWPSLCAVVGEAGRAGVIRALRRNVRAMLSADGRTE